MTSLSSDPSKKMIENTAKDVLTRAAFRGNILSDNISLENIFGSSIPGRDVIMARDDISSYLPLTETTYYILLALTEPLHGYAVMRKIQGISEGTVNVGAGTLYNAVSKLQQEGLIVKVQEDDRRKFYHLTEKGRLVLRSQIVRLEIMTQSGRQAVESFS